MTHTELWLQKLRTEEPELLLRMEEPLSRHTTFRIGGPAECMVFPADAKQLCSVLRLADELELPLLLLGAGSNVLAPDAGLRGIVVKTRERMTELRRLEEGRLLAGSGVTLARLANLAAEASLSGLEFAQGIPGTVGGGIYMNAGAYGGEMAAVVETVTTVTRRGELQTLGADDLEFSYRSSALMHRDAYIVSATFSLPVGEQTQIRARMEELAARRRASQPLELPSAGSAFRRPEGAYAAALIDQAGLRGFRIGGAAVSEKHAGFVVNLGGATADDVRRLLEKIQQTVLERSGIRLEPEIRLL